MATEVPFHENLPPFALASFRRPWLINSQGNIRLKYCTLESNVTDTHEQRKTQMTKDQSKLAAKLLCHRIDTTYTILHKNYTNERNTGKIYSISGQDFR